MTRQGKSHEGRRGRSAARVTFRDFGMSLLCGQKCFRIVFSIPAFASTQGTDTAHADVSLCLGSACLGRGEATAAKLVMEEL
ncbi:hypothetical protein E2C01_030842 [Portunus trituberculatus]|uniref:Uncharacterized protein n=1 Tax=Portunus trituberculatus TaxID=210409 RepID=A0A5B7EWE7_PORTR|nr:hypothetical protein [Portunus trituberculatus]